MTRNNKKKRENGEIKKLAAAVGRVLETEVHDTQGERPKEPESTQHGQECKPGSVRKEGKSKKKQPVRRWVGKGVGRGGGEGGKVGTARQWKCTGPILSIMRVGWNNAFANGKVDQVVKAVGKEKGTVPGRVNYNTNMEPEMKKNQKKSTRASNLAGKTSLGGPGGEKLNHAIVEKYGRDKRRRKGGKIQRSHWCLRTGDWKGGRGGLGLWQDGSRVK